MLVVGRGRVAQRFKSMFGQLGHVFCEGSGRFVFLKFILG